MTKIHPIMTQPNTATTPRKATPPVSRRKIRPISTASAALSVLMATAFAPATYAAPPPHALTNVSHAAVVPRASAYNTRNKSGREKVIPRAPAVKRLPARSTVARPATTAPLQSVDYLLFCNQPERLSSAGAYADAKLIGGRTYRIFYHYRNVSGKTAPLTLAFHGTAGKPLHLQIRKGVADAQNDPPRAGRQALVRYMEARPTALNNARGAISLSSTLRPYDTASGIVTVRPSQDCRFRILFAEGRRPVRGSHITAIPTPRREVPIHLTDKSPIQYVRIGAATDLSTPSSRKSSKASVQVTMDGSYGLVYSFSVKAPAGRRVRVTFSPRGGQSGMVAQLNGAVRSSNIIGPAGLAVFAESTVSDRGFGLVTMPFGGVFYPVEIAFHLL